MRMVFAKCNYKDENEMWEDIKSFLRILTKNEQIVKFYCDEPALGIYCVEYESEPELSGKSLEWVEVE